MSKYQLTSLDRLQFRIYRKLVLFRGRIAGWRGATIGQRFGLEQGVEIYYPKCLKVGDDVTIGEYSYLHCLAERGVQIGNNTSIDRNLWLHCGGTLADYSHGFFKLGDRSYIGCNAVMGAGGGILIGDDVLIGQNVNFHAENHNYHRVDVPIREQGVNYKGIVVEDDVWIGAKVTVLDGVTIGQGAIIGAGAVVTQSIPPYGVALGTPARVVKYRKVVKEQVESTLTIL